MDGRWQVVGDMCKLEGGFSSSLPFFSSSSVFTFLVFQINVFFKIYFGLFRFLSAFLLFFLHVFLGYCWSLLVILGFILCFFCCFSQFFPPLLVSLCLSQFSQFSQCFYVFLREGFITKTLHLIHKKGLGSPPPNPLSTCAKFI